MLSVPSHQEYLRRTRTTDHESHEDDEQMIDIRAHHMAYLRRQGRKLQEIGDEYGLPLTRLGT